LIVYNRNLIVELYSPSSCQLCRPYYKLVNKIKLHYRTDRTRPEWTCSGRTRPAGATST